MNYIPFRSLNLNTHAQLLPVDKCIALGVQGIRADEAAGQVTEKKARQLINHYKLPVLWMVSQLERDPIPSVRKLYRAGIRDIEAVNEPENPEPGFHLEPEEVADRCILIKAKFPSVRVYGPSYGIWLPQLIDRFVKRIEEQTGQHVSKTIAAISGHEYWSKIEYIPHHYLECMRRWGVPFYCTEVGFQPLPNWERYPVTIGQKEGIKQAKVALGNLPWVLFDGPEDGSNPGIGLFTGPGWNQTTALYEDLVSAKASSEAR
jgi:hypothetical protein